MTETPPRPFAISENTYGHLKRLRWIISHLRKDDVIVELGCGTGYMVTLPLVRLAYRVSGVDLDEPSIAYGRNLFRQAGLDTSCLCACDLADLDVAPDVIIASEVLEHVGDDKLGPTLQTMRGKLKPGGRLLVTVPNGYGWFEIESLLWFKLRLGYLIESLHIGRAVRRAKRILLGRDVHDEPLSTLSASPHVQRFTYRSIQELLAREGFRIEETTGSVLCAGPFSNLFLSGIGPIMRLNCRLGELFPCVAAAFFVSCSKDG